MFTFIIGINLASNFIPQGAISDMVILKIAQDYKIEDFTYKNLLIYGFIFAIFHMLLSIGWISILIFIK
ncbi:MAG: hypothetical protein JXA99_01470 [Candidatus Lokiarchaeota archaeon]|nr:hypothetical protein [Candidatus Lokiarchaeota archaeon]